MDELLNQLDLNSTFFSELGIIAFLFLVLTQTYFKPFLKLIEARHQKTVEDREAAERLMAQAQSKLDDYKKLITEERVSAKKTYEEALLEAKKLEAEILGKARDEAKRITQDAAHTVSRERDQMKNQLEKEVEALSQKLSELLLSRNA